MLALPEEALLASRKPGAIAKPKFTIAPHNSNFSGHTTSRTVQFEIKPTEVGNQKIYLCLFGSAGGAVKRLSSWMPVAVRIEATKPPPPNPQPVPKPDRHSISDRSWCEQRRIISKIGNLIFSASVRLDGGGFADANFDLDSVVTCDDGKLVLGLGDLRDKFVMDVSINGTKLVGN